MSALRETLQRHVDGGSVPGAVGLVARGDDVEAVSEAHPCDGLRLKALEGGCVAGVAALSNAEEGHYVVRGTLTATFLCDNIDKDPCKRVKDWRGPAPTPQHPVLITGESTSLDTSIDVPRSKSSSPDGSPSSRSPSPPDGVSPPPVSPSPESPHDSSPASEEG